MMAEQHSRLACWLGFKMSEAGDGRIYAIAPGESHVGNPLIRALHGGIVSTFLEFAAVHELRLAIPAGAPAEALNINVDFLKSAKLAPLFARARVLPSSIVSPGRKTNLPPWRKRHAVSASQKASQPPLLTLHLPPRLRPGGLSCA
jgi:uncharacterized protein (TIGR00369 family)